MNNRIYIVNFEEYNPRKDIKKHSWFRVDNTISSSRKLHGLSPAQKWFWICLVSLCSFEQRDHTEMDYEYWSHQFSIPLEDLKSAIDHFKKKGMISFEAETITVSKTENEEKTKTNVGGTDTNAHERKRALQTDITDNTLQTDKTDNNTTTAENFKISAGFEDEPILKEVLPFISPTVQENWLKRYEKTWITQVLVDAVMYYLNKTNQKPHEIKDWGGKLVAWVRRQKKPMLGASTPNPINELCNEILEQQGKA